MGRGRKAADSMNRLKNIFLFLTNICLGAIWGSCPTPARADAIIRTDAMLATTIAEYFVEADGITVELEIGFPDVEAFKNILPDALYKQIEKTSSPLKQRLEHFVSHDLRITDGSGPLPGTLVTIEPRRRIKRDEISGEPLPLTEEDTEQVVFTRLFYAYRNKAEQLTFHGLKAPSKAIIGYVVYHQGIPINDFRYLTPSQTVVLDWDDPWFSRFTARHLRRTYYAPMSGFIYVEPYEVRKEIIVRPFDLQNWLDLGLAGRKTIPVEMQDGIKQKVAGFLRDRQTVVIDEEKISPELARVNFLERTLKTSRVINPPQELNIFSAVLGVIFVYPTEGLPQHVTMEWDLFNERITQVSAASVDEAGSLPILLEPEAKVLEWRNFLKDPKLPTLSAISLPPSLLAQSMYFFRWVIVIIFVWSLARIIRVRERRSGIAAILPIVTLLAGLGAFSLADQAKLSDERARQIVSGLLHNVYHAFNFRKEDQIYDVLSKSVSGDLLTRIYLETRKGLELANQGGARAKVKQIVLQKLSTAPAPNGGFTADTEWNVSGAVGHWGHVHKRKNRYHALLQIEPIEGVWKLTDTEILEEQRL